MRYKSNLQRDWLSPGKTKLATKSSRHWGVLPGNWDKINSSIIFDADNYFGIPDLQKSDFVPHKLLYYGRWKDFETAPRGSAVHFWQDDYRFEGLWNNPNLNLERLKHIGCVITPDFSIFTDWPHVLNMWQVYRNRWLGCYWQLQGLNVIPSVAWATEESFDYAFSGVPQGGVIGIQTHCVRPKDEEHKRLFRLGFTEMLRVLEPQLILSYGSLNRVGDLPDAPVKEFKTFWDEKNAILHPKKVESI